MTAFTSPGRRGEGLWPSFSPRGGLYLAKIFVMPGLVPGIHALLCFKPWMAGTSPAVTD